MTEPRSHFDRMMELWRHLDADLQTRKTSGFAGRAHYVGWFDREPIANTGPLNFHEDTAGDDHCFTLFLPVPGGLARVARHPELRGQRSESAAISGNGVVLDADQDQVDAAVERFLTEHGF